MNEIIVTIKREDKLLRIEIEDHGPGVKAEERDQLFRFDSDISTETSEGEKKLGAGLWFAAKMINSIDGKIGARTHFIQPGKASRSAIHKALLTAKTRTT